MRKREREELEGLFFSSSLPPGGRAPASPDSGLETGAHGDFATRDPALVLGKYDLRRGGSRYQSWASRLGRPGRSPPPVPTRRNPAKTSRSGSSSYVPEWGTQSRPSGRGEVCVCLVLGLEKLGQIELAVSGGGRTRARAGAGGRGREVVPRRGKCLRRGRDPSAHGRSGVPEGCGMRSGRLAESGYEADSTRAARFALEQCPDAFAPWEEGCTARRGDGRGGPPL